MYWSIASFMTASAFGPIGEAADGRRPRRTRVIPVGPTLTIINCSCAFIVATDKRCGRIIGRSTTKRWTASIFKVEARRLEKFVGCMFGRYMAAMPPFGRYRDIPPSVMRRRNMWATSSFKAYVREPSDVETAGRHETEDVSAATRRDGPFSCACILARR